MKHDLNTLKKAWQLTQIEGNWKKEMGDDRPMNKKNIVQSLLQDEIFQSDMMFMFMDRGEYHGLSLGNHYTTEDSVLHFINTLTNQIL
jgi:hypothetical protein